MTILSGDLGTKDNDNITANEATRADNSYTVVLATGVDATAILDGFQVASGNANASSSVQGSGGGIYIGTSAAPTFANLTIYQNTTDGAGAGIYNSQGTPTLTSIAFIGNIAGTSVFRANGGGIYNRFGTVTMANSVFSGNETNGWGGAIYNLTANLTVFVFHHVQ